MSDKTPNGKGVQMIFAWYDLWVGVFIDRPNHRLYLFPLPCVGFRVQW